MSSYKFIASGVVCDINDDKADIERKVQYVIDERCGGYAKFRYDKLADNKVRLIYFRDLLYPGKHKIIFDSDMSLLTGIKINGFQEDGYPFLWPLDFVGRNYCASTQCFLRFYSFLLHKEKQDVNGVKARMYSDRVVLEVELKKED